MFVRRRGVWFGFVEKMFLFCSAKSRKLVFLAKTTVILRHIRLGTTEEVLHELVIKAAAVFVSNKFMSSYLICLVIAREIFLP